MESKVNKLYLCETFRKYLINDTELKTLISDVYFVDKPIEKTDEEYVTYNYKLVNGGLIKSYQLTINCIGQNLFKVMKIQEKIEFLLDDYENKNVIKDGKNIVRSCTLLNGGGQIYDDERKEYICISYFLFKI